MKISEDIKIIQWFDLADFSERTQNQYAMRMELFCDCAGKSPSELITEAISETKQGLLLSERKNLEYMAKFKAELKRRKYSPKATASAVSVVKTFYNAFDIQLSSSIGKIRKASTLRENRTFLKKEDIIKLINNANSLRNRAIILVMATSGMARKEIMNLRVRDISIDTDGIGTVTMRRQKNDIDFITFISPEAVQALKLYWEERERNRNGAFKIKGDIDYVFVTSHNGKKIHTNTFSAIFKKMANQLGYKNKNNNGEDRGFQILCKSHALRKFFSSTLEDAGFPRKKIEFMLAHSLSNNELAYYENEVKKLKDLYINFLPHITFEKEIRIVSLSTEDEKRLHQLEEKEVKTDARLKEMELLLHIKDKTIEAGDARNQLNEALTKSIIGIERSNMDEKDKKRLRKIFAEP